MKPTTFFSLGYVETKLAVTWALCMRGGCQLAEQGQLATRLTVAAAHPNHIWAQLDRRWVALHGQIPALRTAATLSHMRAAGARSWGCCLCHFVVHFARFLGNTQCAVGSIPTPTSAPVGEYHVTKHRLR
jgi:hypothetical protein